MKGYDQRLAVLEIGLGGCSGSYAAENARVTMYDKRISAYYGDVVEGGFVIVKTAILDARPSLAFSSPMCQGNLPLGTRDEFQGAAGSIVAHAIASDGENPARGLAAMMIANPKCGAFDFVAPDVYAAWWREAGAKVGVRRGDRIEWDNGDSEAIRPVESRWAC